jgi:3-hydroxyisobutyrate dehydrogenase and related beta-hydroxyacid dehydrogenases
MNTPTIADSATHTVAFLGLGVMGDPMAGHLARAGHRVTVYNRTASKAHDWVRRNGGIQRRHRAKPQRGPTSCSPASATMTTCAR